MAADLKGEGEVRMGKGGVQFLQADAVDAQEAEAQVKREAESLEPRMQRGDRIEEKKDIVDAKSKPQKENNNIHMKRKKTPHPYA